MSGLFTKTYVKFLFGFLGIIALAVIVILFTGTLKENKGDIDASDVNFAQPQETSESQ